MVDIVAKLSVPPQPQSILDIVKENSPYNNCSDDIKARCTLSLLNQSNHPLFNSKVLIVSKIKDYFSSSNLGEISFKEFQNPVVSVKQNFDNILTPKDHYCRRPTDVYYINEILILRTNLTLYLPEVLRSDGGVSYVVSGDVYHRVEEDEFHSELSHQVREN